MRKPIITSIVVFVGILALLFALLQMGKKEESAQDGVESSSNASMLSVDKRPTCPKVNFETPLPCLGAGVDSAPAQAEYTVVNVWAWWCGPCREELPAIDAFAKEHPEYAVVGVHADPNAANGAALLNDLNVDLPSYQDGEGMFAATYALPNVVPITLLLDQNGKLIGQKAQVFHSASELDAAIKAMVDGQ
ncbi:TlpA family protein disulfide reductase [Corynebacterium pelargi]|uniref:Sporulation thiol-disulfide oxidoreductase A n=1 Tax=Corynebacterium pelargi TaxID=1471400 RepID=A0A410WBH3_9CORY|nr:TlpA disulfide reductase family protein [Corynebacterium pelargi]QAU53299.1 Sporulation thiol-disulfide oxidoreductase A precursor [Corynebacterium pelargi]GGG73451.1 membrane protein [Corynebacterium pelargi]